MRIELDPETGTCTIDGETVRLDRGQFHLLSLLNAKTGKLVLTSEIREALWPNKEPCPSALGSLIYSLRAKLPKKVIYNIPGYGYGVRGEHGGLIAVIVPEDEGPGQAPRDLQLDFTKLGCWVDGAFVGLRPKQFQLLAVLYANAGRFVDYNFLEKTLMGSMKPGQVYLTKVVSGLRMSLPKLVVHERRRASDGKMAYGIADSEGNIGGVTRSQPVSPFEGA